MDTLELAWKLIDLWKDDYADEADMISEVGNLNDLSLTIMETIERLGLQNERDMAYLSAMVEQELF